MPVQKIIQCARKGVKFLILAQGTYSGCKSKPRTRIFDDFQNHQNLLTRSAENRKIFDDFPPKIFACAGPWPPAPSRRCLGAHPETILTAAGPRALKRQKFDVKSIFKNWLRHHWRQPVLASKMRPKAHKSQFWQTGSNWQKVSL